MDASYIFLIPFFHNVSSSDAYKIQFQTHMERNVLESVTSGTLLAFEECQKVFKWERWNCPKSYFDRNHNKNANKESAFTEAIIAAGIVYAITRNCSKGRISECGCNPKYAFASSPTKFYHEISTNSSSIKWSWGGCSDDVTFASQISRELLEQTENELTLDFFIERHNYRVGRQMIQQSLVKKCRCHGVSGSCSLQTCWMQLAPFQYTAKRLKEKYRKAKRVTKEAVETSIAVSNSVREKKASTGLAGENILIYLEQSPDYCLPNTTTNWPGTKGRSCSKMSTGVEKRSCNRLCRQCGYKVKRERRIVKKRCNCTFEWCCAVKCDTCSELLDEFYCQ